MNKFTKTAVFVLLTFFSLNANAQNKENEILYVSGNLHDKTEAVKKASENGDDSLSLKALEFTMTYHDLLSDNEEFKELLVTAIANLGKNPAETQNISSKLCQIFKNFSNSEDETILVEVIKKFRDYNSPSCVSLVNSYVSEKIRENHEWNTIIEESVKYLQSSGNVTSFRLIFVADILGIWPDETEKLSAAWGPLANESENEVLQILAASQFDQKLQILEAVQKNPFVSKKIRSEVAENALSEAIYNIGETSDTIIQLQLKSLKIISSSQWTRAAGLATDYFSVARSEYEKGYMSAEDFASVITDIASVASSETGQILSQYLDFLNKSKEQNNAPVEAVVLSVINALGGLGDKTAFDYLLYVTYLDYSQEVNSAAKSALAKLKW